MSYISFSFKSRVSKLREDQVSNNLAVERGKSLLRLSGI